MANKENTESEILKNQVDTSAKLFDVAGPGKTPALATSRPIIVKHGSMVTRDPMVVEEDIKEPTEPEPEKAINRELKIEPDSTESDKTEATGPELETEDNPAKAPEDEPGKDEDATQESSESGAVDTLVNEVDAKQADKKQKKELEERTLELEKIINSKEFFVPIGVASRRRSNRRIVWLLILIVVLGLVGLNFAVDAGLLDIGVQALTDLL